MKHGTYHATVERSERIFTILTKIGLGKVIKEVYQPMNNTVMQLTDTGVIMIVANDDRDRVITMYTASYKELKFMFNEKRLPNYLIKQMKKNKKIMNEKA